VRCIHTSLNKLQDILLRITLDEEFKAVSILGGREIYTGGDNNSGKTNLINKYGEQNPIQKGALKGTISGKEKR